MKIDFEVVKDFEEVGQEVEFYNFPNEVANFLYLKDGRLMSNGFRVPHSEFENIFAENMGVYDVSKHDNITNLTLRKLDRFGAIGSYRVGDEHYLLIFELALDVSDHVVSASISEMTENPIRQIQLTLENPESIEKAHGKNLLISEDGAFAIPGSMVQVYIEIGEESQNFGKFYLDHTSWDILQSSANLDGRSITGRKLKDKTVNDNKISEIQDLQKLLKQLIVDIAGVYAGDVDIQSTYSVLRFSCTPETDILSAILQALEREPEWSIKETLSGKILVGENKTNAQIGLSHKNMFQRKMTLDDANVYSKVCVWCNATETEKHWEKERKEQQVTDENGQTTTQWVEEWVEKEETIQIVRRAYKDVAKNKFFGLENGKTLFVQAVAESWQEQLEDIANNLVLRIENVGKTEDISVPFSPWLECGDEAMFNGESLGLISKINHRFGQQGAFTDITIDSGGTLATKSLKDYLLQLTKETQRASALSQKP